jgi:hypothetical protein
MSELPLPFAPLAPVARLTRVVVFATRSRTNVSTVRSVSDPRFVAKEPKETRVPSPEIDGLTEVKLPLTPFTPVARLARIVVSVWMSRT